MKYANVQPIVVSPERYKKLEQLYETVKKAIPIIVVEALGLSNISVFPERRASIFSEIHKVLKDIEDCTPCGDTNLPHDLTIPAVNGEDTVA